MHPIFLDLKWCLETQWLTTVTGERGGYVRVHRQAPQFLPPPARARNPTRLHLPSFLQLFIRRMSLSVGGYITDKASAARRTSVFFYLPVVVRAL